MNNFIRRVQTEFNNDFSLAALRLSIIVIALAAIVAALAVKSKWVLAGILAYLILP